MRSSFAPASLALPSSLLVVAITAACPPGKPPGGEGGGEGEGAAGEGEGGAAGEGEGAAGEGEGAAGEGEGEGAPADEFCQPSCTSDADCSGNTPKCDTTDGVCVAAACTSDDLCTAQNSGWNAIACTADADCFGTGFCIDLDGAGAGTTGGCGF